MRWITSPGIEGSNLGGKKAPQGFPGKATFSLPLASGILLRYLNTHQPGPPRGFHTAAIYRNKGKLIKINDSCNLNGALFRIKSPAGALAVYVHVLVFFFSLAIRALQGRAEAQKDERFRWKTNWVTFFCH